MNEERIMENQQQYLDDRLVAYVNVPYFLLDDDVDDDSRNSYMEEFGHIAWLYDRYEGGADFLTEGSNADYTPSQLAFKKAAMIMNKEARFLFSNPPTFNINRDDVDTKYAEENAIVQNFLDEVLDRNNFNGSLMKAVKDCFIGKRVAAVVNLEPGSGITITFLNSMEFLYETSDKRDGEISKFVTFYETKHSSSISKQRWFKKIYEKDDEGVFYEEKIFSGDGTLIEVVSERTRIRYPYIPVTVILNDGLTGDKRGVSELEDLIGYESYYSKLANADMDAMRKSMNPTRYTMDVSENSTKNLSTSPGSYWDLQSDEEKSEEKVGKVGILEPAMHYSAPLKTTLDRIENQMYSAVDVPNINRDQLAGVITSGKTIGALYWGLTVRCDEKMLAWQHSLVFIAKAIIDGAKLYPDYVKRYLEREDDPEVLPDIRIKVTVENNYPIPEDIKEEKETDLNEVLNKVRSKKSYIKKWQKMNDKDADKELEQIKAEQEMFENALAKSYNGDGSESSSTDTEDDSSNNDSSTENDNKDETE